MAKEITVDNFELEVLKSNKPVLVDFWAVWCGPCTMLTPTINKLAKDYEGRAVVGKVNVDEQAALAERYRIMSIPSVYLFKDGEVVFKTVGAKPYAELAAEIDKFL